MLRNGFELQHVETSRAARSKLVLNFSHVQFSDVEIIVGCLPYGQDGEHVLRQLRRQHNRTHVFRRHGADRILAVSVLRHARLIGEPERIRLKDHLGLAAALVRNALLTYLAGIGRTILSCDPLTFIARGNILRTAVPAGTALPDWLAVHLMYEVAVRPIQFFEQVPFVAAVFDVRTIRLVERTASDLIKDGMSLKGFYVGNRLSSEDARIAPRFRSLGCVETANSSLLRLTDSRDDIETIDASDVWLDKRVFAACLSHVFKERATEIAAALERELAAMRDGPARLNRISRIVDFLRTQQHEMVPDLPFEFGPLLDSSNTLFPRLEPAPRPVYVFDYTGSKTDTWNDRGLNEHGPYTAQVLAANRPRICVVCQQSMKGQVEQFLHKFADGIEMPVAPSHFRIEPSKNSFEKGFCRKYRLEAIHYEYFLAENSSADAYKKACEQAIERLGEGQKWDLALIQIEEAFRQLPPERNPYLLSKVSFYTHQILVQEFKIETTRKRDSPLSYALNSMGLATYAKLNGIPWLLKADSTTAHELVIGLGSANVGQGRLSARERFIGIATVFSADGNYYLSNLSKAASIAGYQSALLESLRSAITKVQRTMNWQPKDHVRLIFHVKFKKFNLGEVHSVKALISEFGDYDVEYAFVHVIQEHPYILFDTAQSGVLDSETKRIKGSFAPERGQYLELGKRDVLLSLKGPHQMKRPEDGLPQPLLLSLHRDSSFTDMTYITRQVFKFSCHSWRTFLPGSLPVTIQYSNRIARSLGSLSLIERWNPEVMLGRIGRTTWFL